MTLLGRRAGTVAAASLGCILTLAWLTVLDAHATPIMLSDKDANFSASVPAGTDCVNPKTGLAGPLYINCVNVSFLNLNEGTALGLGGTNFGQSFDAWNMGNPNDGKWTIKDGGALPGGDLDVVRFRTFVNRDATIGGVDIGVNWDYDGADKSQFKWVQGLFDNYNNDGTIKPAIYEMDVRQVAGCDNADLSKQCPPLYPLQFEGRGFEDTPRAPWPNGFFQGFAYLAKVDFDTRQLTVYEGFAYGFTLSADPKPAPGLATLTSLLVGALGARMARRRVRDRTPRA